MSATIIKVIVDLIERIEGYSTKIAESIVFVNDDKIEKHCKKLFASIYKINRKRKI